MEYRPSFTQGSEPHQPGVRVLGGRDSLEVVGESRYQDALWHIVGEHPGGADRIRKTIVAVLRPDTDNAYDANAVDIIITDHKVGYLSRNHAAEMQEAILRMEAEHHRPIGLRGAIVGGGMRKDGPGQLGVFLSYHPPDFGLQPSDPPVRTGFSASARDDAQYAMPWMDGLSKDSAQRIPQVRALLEADTEAIHRHFMFAQLERDLYYSRDAFSSALDEYDDACVQHDAEMVQIRPALIERFGSVPLLSTYRQMSIRQHKAKNWEAGLHWAERGLSLYGSDAANPTWPEDLAARAAAFQTRLSST